MVNLKLSDYLDASELIKEIRNRKKISQKRLGQRIGVSSKTVSAYERGQIIPSIDNLIRILYVGGYVLDIKEDIYKTPKKMGLPNA